MSSARERERGSEQRKQEIYGSKIFSPFLVIIRSASAARRGRTDGGDAAKFPSTPFLPPSLPTTKIYPSSRGRHGWFELNLGWDNI